MHRRESWARGSKTNGGATSLVMELCDGGIGAQVKSDASTSIGRAQSGGARGSMVVCCTPVWRHQRGGWRWVESVGESVSWGKHRGAEEIITWMRLRHVTVRRRDARRTHGS